MKVKTKEEWDMESKKKGIQHRTVSRGSQRKTTVLWIQTSADPARLEQVNKIYGRKVSQQNLNGNII